MSRTSQCFLRDGENNPPGGVEVICEMLQDQAVVRQEIDVNVGVIGILSFSRFLDHAEGRSFVLFTPLLRSTCFHERGQNAFLMRRLQLGIRRPCATRLASSEALALVDTRD